MFQITVNNLVNFACSMASLFRNIIFSLALVLISYGHLALGDETRSVTRHGSGSVRHFWTILDYDKWDETDNEILKSGTFGKDVTGYDWQIQVNPKRKRVAIVVDTCSTDSDEIIRSVSGKLQMASGRHHQAFTITSNFENLENGCRSAQEFKYNKNLFSKRRLAKNFDVTARIKMEDGFFTSKA